MDISRTQEGQRIYRGWNKDRQRMERGITVNGQMKGREWTYRPEVEGYWTN